MTDLQGRDGHGFAKARVIKLLIEQWVVGGIWLSQHRQLSIGSLLTATLEALGGYDFETRKRGISTDTVEGSFSWLSTRAAACRKWVGGRAG